MRSDLSNTGTDIVGGLRVLRGIGGEGVFLDRYRRESQATRTAAVNVAKLQSVLDALQVFLPGIFVVAGRLAGRALGRHRRHHRRRARRLLRLLRLPDAARCAPRRSSPTS